jgi:cyclopropane-fatty-acyl-phospholipid synthase
MTLTAVPQPASPVIDPARWPDVAAVPRNPARAAIARALFARACAALPVCVDQAGGPPLGAGLPGSPVMTLNRPADFYQRVGASGLTGFGEAYMAGDWDSPDLAGLLTVFGGRIGNLIPAWLQRLRGLAVRPVPAADEPTLSGARRNVARHYDLSNELFGLFLDPTMTYSAALFEHAVGGAVDGPPMGREEEGEFLAAAQRRKIDRLLDRAGVGPGCRVLEIGTGWGELAIRAGERGARVKSVTISARQHALASRRVAAAGLSSRVSVDMADYRELTGRYDVVLSVEMIEAVGEPYWPAYFGALARLVAPGGVVGLQAITMPHQRMLATRRTQTWVLKYIFPGGLIPSDQAISAAAAAAGLSVTERFDFGPHYARTLRIWRERFNASAGQLPGLGFDEVFRRMWLLYLAYAEAGFRSGYLDVSQVLLAPARTAGVTSGRDPRVPIPGAPARP